jgi:hypothetical protein
MGEFCFGGFGKFWEEALRGGVRRGPLLCVGGVFWVGWGVGFCRCMYYA